MGQEQRICGQCFQEKPEGICPHCGFDDTAYAEQFPHALPVGTILAGKYVLGRVLGQGGFGITYLAQEYHTKERVAIKEYFPDLMASRVSNGTVAAYTGERGEHFSYGKVRFLEEAETLAEFIGDPAIIRIFNYFEENGTAYFVMEYIEGQSLQHYVRSKGSKLSWEETSRYLLPVMDALEAVHAKGIIHRDVTPDNIFLTKQGKIKLLDFGSARYSLGDKSKSLDVVLKHGFAPKEQYTRRGKQGRYTDVYSLAASFYYLLTGKLPPESIDRMEEDDLIAPSSLGISLPGRAEDAIIKALSVDPKERFQSMAEFRAALLPQFHAAVFEDALPVQPDEPHIPADPQPTPPPPPPPLTPKPGFADWLRKNGKLIAGVGGVAVLALVIGLSLGRRQNPPAAETVQPAAGDTSPAVSQADPQTPDADTQRSYDYNDPVIPAPTQAPTQAPEKRTNMQTPFYAANSSVPCFQNGRSVFVESTRRGVMLCADGSVGVIDVLYGNWENAGVSDVRAAAVGFSHTLLLRSNGTVTALGEDADNDGRMQVSGWSDITAVAAGYKHSVGLRSDGTVVAAGTNASGQLNVSGWQNIRQIAAGHAHTVGLRSDGTVTAAGANQLGQCDVSGWRDIQEISAAFKCTVGLKRDGTVLAVGDNEMGQCNVSGWSNIIAVSTGGEHTVGLRQDGTVTATGNNENGQCNVSGWDHIVAVYAGYTGTLGIREDGTVLYTGFSQNVRCWF